MVNVDVLQRQTDSWASTNWNRSDGTQFTTFTFDYLKMSVSSSNQEAIPTVILQPASSPMLGRAAARDLLPREDNARRCSWP